MTKDTTIGGLTTTTGSAVPLRGVDVTGELVGGVLHVRVRQRYENVEKAPIEAIYTFPLPGDAAVTGFVMESGGRRLEGVALEREAAFRKYDEALLAGHGAALVDQERANVFTASVGNVLAGETVVIELEYVARVAVDEGSLRVSIPTLVAPRYIPGAASGDRTAFGSAEPTTRVPDADRISPAIGAADYRVTLELALHVDRKARIGSPSHAISVEPGEHVQRVRFAHGAVLLDRDVIVNVEGTGGEAGIDAVAAHREAGQGYVAITHVPELPSAKVAPLSVVFVVDRSGSMGGLSIEEARRALRLCLRQLREGDRFTILAFDDRIEEMSRALVPFTDKTLRDADAFVARVDARGGTELLAPLERAVQLAKDGVVVLLTDGQVGNEQEILARVMPNAGRTRFYTFGIGTNVSDVLLGELAGRSGGAKELVYPGERIDDKVVATFSKAIARRVRDVTISFDGAALDDVAPSRVPDLVDGEPFTLLARYGAPGAGAMVLKGTLDGEAFAHRVAYTLPHEAHAPAVAKLWARERVRDLEAMPLEGRRGEAMKERIVSLCKEHGLASKYTSFVVVETRSGDRRTTEAAAARPVPVNAPHGWAMFDQGAAPGSLAGGAGGMRTRAGVASFAMAAPMPMSPAPMGKVAAPRRMTSMGAPPPSPAQSAEAAPAAKGRSILGAIKDAFSPRAAAPGASPGAPPAAAPPPPPAFEARLAEEEADGFDDLSLAAPAAMDVSVRREDGGADPILALLTTQRASGLFADGADERALALTTDALGKLLAAGITSGHALYGEQVKRAIEAVVALASKLGTRASVERALALAFLLASGKRTRRSVESAIDTLAPTLRPRLGDEGALRQSLGA